MPGTSLVQKKDRKKAAAATSGARPTLGSIASFRPASHRGVFQAKARRLPPEREFRPSFLGQQRAFPLYTPAIAGESAVAPHHAVAGNGHCDRVGAQARATARTAFGAPIRLAISA